ncbi:unnamed protein product, partial [Phaeothamnion confervicola]
MRQLLGSRACKPALETLLTLVLPNGSHIRLFGSGSHQAEGFEGSGPVQAVVGFGLLLNPPKNSFSSAFSSRRGDGADSGDHAGGGSGDSGGDGDDAALNGGSGCVSDAGG